MLHAQRVVAISNDTLGVAPGNSRTGAVADDHQRDQSVPTDELTSPKTTTENERRRLAEERFVILTPMGGWTEPRFWGGYTQSPDSTQLAAFAA